MALTVVMLELIFPSLLFSAFLTDLTRSWRTDSLSVRHDVFANGK